MDKNLPVKHLGLRAPVSLSYKAPLLVVVILFAAVCATMGYWGFANQQLTMNAIHSLQQQSTLQEKFYTQQVATLTNIIEHRTAALQPEYIAAKLQLQQELVDEIQKKNKTFATELERIAAVLQQSADDTWFVTAQRMMVHELVYVAQQHALSVADRSSVRSVLQHAQDINNQIRDQASLVLGKAITIDIQRAEQLEKQDNNEAFQLIRGFRSQLMELHFVDPIRSKATVAAGGFMSHVEQLLNKFLVVSKVNVSPAANQQTFALARLYIVNELQFAQSALYNNDGAAYANAIANATDIFQQYLYRYASATILKSMERLAAVTVIQPQQWRLQSAQTLSVSE